MKRIIEGLFCDDVKSNVFNFYKNKNGKWVAEKDVFFEKEYVKKYLETNCVERNHVLYDTDDFWACEICGEVFPNGCDSTDVEKIGRVCDTCFENECHQCNCCGKYFSKDDLVRDIDGEYVCGDCIEDNYHRCDGCGALVIVMIYIGLMIVVIVVRVMKIKKNHWFVATTTTQILYTITQKERKEPVF